MNPNLPSGGVSQTISASGAGNLEASLSISFTAVSAGHAVSADQFEPGIPLDKQAFYHDLDFALINAELAFGYSLASWVTLETKIPVRSAYVQAHFLDEANQPLDDFESIHHRDEAIVGLGDVAFGARFMLIGPGVIDGLMLFGSLGVTAPSGGTRPNPFELGRQGKRHQHIFFGSGTVDPYATLAASYAMGWGRLSAFLYGRMALYENAYGYKGPGTLYSGIDATSDFTLSYLEASLGAHVMKEFPAKWGDENAENSGRTDLMVALGATYIMNDAWRLRAGLKIPVYTDTVGGQLQIPVIADIGISFSGNILD